MLRSSRSNGFEPRTEDGGIALANCPFHTLAREHTELVCGMNLRLIGGVLDGVRASGLVARLRPEPGHVLRPARRGAGVLAGLDGPVDTGGRRGLYF